MMIATAVNRQFDSSTAFVNKLHRNTCICTNFIGFVAGKLHWNTFNSNIVQPLVIYYALTRVIVTFVQVNVIHFILYSVVRMFHLTRRGATRGNAGDAPPLREGRPPKDRPKLRPKTGLSPPKNRVVPFKEGLSPSTKNLWFRPCI